MTDTDIETLIKTFDMNIEELKSGKQKKEAEIRKNYIDPLFEALGWNLRNAGLHEHEKEVVAQYPVKGEPGIQKADYCFRLNGKDMFYVEAKAPSVNIETNRKAAFQIRRYCWSAKVLLGVLTDFEKFAIYDGRHEPKITDSTDTARIIFFNYKQYKDKWNEIAGLFSKEAVRNGSLERYIKEAKLKKGIPVDEAFLKDMEHWREILAVNIASLNPELSGREISFAVQRTIDRIVFLRICEDRGTEAHGRMQRLSVKRNICSGLVKLFREAATKYNSGIFCLAADKDRTEGIDTPNLKIDDSVLKTVIERLYYPSPYNFSVMPADILGQIYECFLGKVIEVSAERKVSVKEKPEVRKAGGVYYTPTYIIDYIVKNTINEQIKGKTPAQVAKMKFLDPACGSGSFLIQAYQHLLNWHLAWYAENDPEKHIKGKRPVLVKDRRGNVRLRIGARRQILLNNIFGLDIDFQAVEVTKLSLLLRVLEGEDDLTLQQPGIFKERALPDLDKNIKCGNSLIGPDYYENVQLNPEDEEEILRVNAFDWNAQFPEIMRNGGFDAVIGNPPYVLLQGEFRNNNQLSYFRKKFDTASYKMDMYHLFVEQSVKRTKQNGLCSLIVPSNFLTNNYLKPLRKFILEKSKVDHILVINGGVFQGIRVDNAVLVTYAGKKTDKFRLLNAYKENFSLKEKSEITVSAKEALNSDYILFTGTDKTDENKVLERIYNKSVLLDSIADINFGKQLRNRKKFASDVIRVESLHSIRSPYRPCYTGRDILRYNLTWNNLACYNDNIARKGGCWDEEKHNAKNKILTRQIGEYPQFALDDKGYQCLNTLFMITVCHKDLNPYFLLGLLNSKIIKKVWLKKFHDQRKTFPKIKGAYLKQLPVCKINLSDSNDKEIYDQIINFVTQITNLNEKINNAKTPQEKALLQSQIEAGEQQTDQLVYKLYGLTDEETKTMEAE